MVRRENRTRWVLGRIAVYGLLGLFGLAMIFPFIFMFSSSLKSPEDVFNYPPRLLPRQQSTVDVSGVGDDLPLYDVELEGDRQELALADDSIPVGIFADPENPASSLEVEMSDAQPVGDPENPDTVTIDGEKHELYTVDVEGATSTMALLNRTSRGLFIDPEDPDRSVLANVRTSKRVETLTTHPENYSKVLTLQTLDRSLTNTTLVTILVVAGQVLTSIMGGYAFARIKFPGRDSLFLIYLGSIMIPFVVLITPLYQLMVAIGWVDHLVALIVPWMFTAYGTFLMRQFFTTVPKELEEAAFIDGASRWTVLWRIFVPLSFPPIATLATFSFLYAWNSFFWPLVVINAGNTDNHVLSLSLQILGGRAAESPNLIFAGVTMAVAVPVAVFVMAQRYFVENVATSGLK